MKIKKDYLTELLSYEPSKETRILILEEVKTTGKTIEEVADKYAMPPMMFIHDDGSFDYEGQKMTNKDFEKRFPHRRFITIGSKKQQDAKLLNQ